MYYFIHLVPSVLRSCHDQMWNFNQFYFINKQHHQCIHLKSVWRCQQRSSVPIWLLVGKKTEESRMWPPWGTEAEKTNPNPKDAEKDVTLPFLCAELLSLTDFCRSVESRGRPFSQSDLLKYWQMTRRPWQQRSGSQRPHSLKRRFIFSVENSRG